MQQHWPAYPALNGSPRGITDAVDRAVAGDEQLRLQQDGRNFPPRNVLFAVNLNGPYMSQGAAAGDRLNIRFVKVTTPDQPVGCFIRRVGTRQHKNLTATATAGFSVPLNVLCNFLPVSVIDYGTPITPGNTYTFRALRQMVSPGNYQILASPVRW